MATNPFSNPDFGSDLLKEDRSANPFSDPNFGKEPEQDGAFIRGLKRAKQSATITTKLATGDTAGTAETIRDAEIYNQQNPSSKESDELSKAWEDGDGITGGIAGVGREFAKDWRESKGFVSGLRETGKNVNALREGIVSQLGNSVAPMVGLVAGGAAGAAAGTAVPVVGNIAGGIAGGWAGAAAGNTLVEGGGQLQDALHKANIDPMDTVAVEKFVAENGDKILGQSAIKGGIIGAVDTATAGIAGRLLNVPARAAVNRALVDMGVDVADKIAVKEAMKNSAAEISSRLASDTAYQASRTGAENIARNAGAAALDPAGEFTGEYVGQGAATGDWNTKNAALEALSSVGQSGAMFAGQKGYQALTNPFRNGKTGEAAPQSNTPITDAAQATGAFPQLPAPSITVNADGTAETAEDRNARIAARAAGDIADVTPIPNTPEYQDVRGFAPAARQTQALEAPTITVDGNGQALTAADRNNRLSDRINGGVTDVTPIQRAPVAPSVAMGLNPANGSLSSAAALAVDSGVTPFGSLSLQGASNVQQTQEAQQAGEGQSQGGRASGAAPKTRAVKTLSGEIVIVNESDLTSGAKSLRTFTSDGKPRAARLDAANIAPPPPKVVLQNRDRSTSASIQQMNDIVAQPDFLKAGTSSTMDRGAPMVFGDLPSKLIVGRTQQVADDSGKRIPTNYAVVEADDLLASNNADGTTNNEYAEGVPGKLRAVAGNGRVAGLQEAWNRGTTGGYAADLAQEAESLGIDPQALAGFSRPVLVRVMDEADVTADIGDRSNIQSNLQLSVLERAGNDVRRMDLRDMEFNDKGNPTSDTMRQFMAAMPTQERGDMLDKQGLPTLQLIDRIKAAAFKQAYMSDSLVELATQSVNDDAKRILNALTMAAGDMVQLDGTGEFDIRQAVADAAGLAVNAAKKGEKLSDYLRTVQIDESPEAIAVARFFEQNSGSANQIADGLRAWANLAKSQVEAARANADQGSMFGETPTLSRNQLFERLSDENITDIEREQLIAQQERAKSIEQSADAESAERAGDADSAPDSEGSSEEIETESFALDQQTPQELQALEEEQAALQQELEQEQRDAEAADRAKQTRDEVTRRSEAAADNFQLGQSAEDSLSGQGDIFAQQQEATPEAPPKTLKEGLERVRAKKAAEKPAKNDATRLGSGATGVADNALSGKDAGAPYQYFEEKTGLIRDVPSMSNRDGTLNDDGKRLAYTEWSAMSEDERALIHEAIAARKSRSQQADDSVRKEYLRAERVRLEGERIILSSNGNPYKTEGAAAKFIEEKGIEESHYAGKVDGGWAAVRRTPSEMLERENGKKGIEDYITIQSRVVAEMGLTQAWGEDAITDAQWEKIDNRVDAIQRGQRGLPPVEQATAEAKPAPDKDGNTIVGRRADGVDEGKTKVVASPPDGDKTATVKKTTSPPVTPQIATPPQLKSMIGIAADSIEKLRKQDVERVLSEAPAPFLQSLAAHIRDKRKDLVDEVAEVMQEVNAKTAPTPTETAPKPEAAPAPTAKKTAAKKPDADKTRAKADLMNALADLGDILGKGNKLFIVPEQEQKLLPVLARVLDAAFRLGYHKFKDASKFALDQMRKHLGDEAADALTIDHLQGAYIAMAGGKKGVDTKRAVIDVETKAEIESHEAVAVDEDGDDSAEPQPINKALPAPAAPKTLAESLFSAIKDGRMPKDNPALKKLVEAFDGRPADQARMKEGQEELETAIVMASREIVANKESDQSTFETLLRLYESQPNLNIRTSTSIANQAYSTPAPLAYLASRLAGITQSTVVHEPTGGTGMLLIGADPQKSIVNELNDLRIATLKSQGFKPTQKDAATQLLVPEGTQTDAVVTNPPFGSLKDGEGKTVKVRVDGFNLGQIDHLIAARALNTLKDDGRATLILGANKVAGGLSTDDRIFFNWLYSNYSVVGHFEVNGDLYTRQGAGWPVRVITINGRKKSSGISPLAGTIQRADNWDQVYEQFTKNIASADAPRNTAKQDAVEAGGKPTTTVATPQAASGQRPKNGTRGDGNVAGAVTRNVPDSAKPDGGAVATVADEQRINAQSYVPKPQQGQGDAGGDRPSQPTRDAALENQGAAGNEFQSPYTPRSSRKDEGVLIPANMAQPTQDALNRIEDAVGDIDEYARSELGYDTVADLHNALMGLQVDSVATAIYQIKQGKAVVIADQTGIGKGRQAASIIRWAAKQGLTPVFVSVKPSLFTDMYGDLADIGTNDVAPFIMNSAEWIAGEGGEKLFTNKPADHKRTIEGIASTAELPDGSNAVFLTYSQINVANAQRRALMALAPNAVFILDESHNAAGASATGEFMIGALDAAKGVVYLSATYAKRPDNMPLYFKTDIGEAAADTEGLALAMASGGLPLQTVVSNNLVKAGQMFRRERSYDGVSIESIFDTPNKDLHERMSDEATKALRAIVAADRMFHNVFVKAMSDELAEQGATVQDSAGNQIDAGVEHTEFSSVVHNFVKQMLLGLKAQPAADSAIASLKRGEKPIIAVESTMGSFLNEYAASNGIAQGASLGAFDYRTVLTRALSRSRVIIEVTPGGDKVKRAIPLGALDAVTRAAYDDAQAVIDGLTLNIPVSPIDWMRAEIQRAGFSVAEITGRNLSVDYSDPKNPILSALDQSEQKDKVNTTRQFNSGKLDALVLNVAGSTGISLHASEKFEDQRQRHMIVAQAAGDINIFMQMLGRVHRTGQVRLPKYSILSADLPTEKRPTAVLSNKMKSLNANTSSNTESATSVKSSDILNKYGDQIVNQYLIDNYPLAVELDLTKSIGTDFDEDLARKATGRLALQPIATQNTFYEEVESQYASLIEYLNKTNQNDLDPRTFDFDAKETRQEVLFDGPDKSTPFGEDAIYGEYSIKAQGTPMKPEEIHSTMAENLGGLTSDAHAQKMLSDLDAKYNTYYASLEDMGKDSAISVRNAGRDFVERHKIGSMFRVDINGEPFNAVVLNVRNLHKESGNPYSMSKMQVSVAINGAIRSLSVPATQFSKIEVSTVAAFFKVEQLFKEQPPNQRETAKIVTGNLLAAYGELKGVRGTIITFTKNDGTSEQGILLPKLFDYSKNTQGDYRLKTSADALKFLQTSDSRDIGRFGISSRDGVVRVLPYGKGIRVQVPKSKLRGAKYFLDKGLIDAGGDFVSSGGLMVATIEDAGKARQVLDLLSKKQALYALPSMAEEAKAMLEIRYSRRDNSRNQGEKDGKPNASPSTATVRSRRLEAGINADLERNGQARLFRAESIAQNELPDALSRALVAFREATGTAVHIFRNLTPQVLDFNGVSFRDGTVHINETSQNPATLTAAHEWLHNLRRTNPDLYRELADEVARQGRLPEYQQRLKRDGETRWANADVVQEELTAAAVSDALTDPVFLQRLAERDQSAFRRVAKAFLEFLKTLTAGWKDQGSNAYLQDVEAFRDKLEQVLDKLPVAKQKPGAIQALFLRVWHGTPHRGIEKTGFKLNKIGTGEGAQAYGWGIYFADEREVSEAYRTALSDPDVDLYLQGKDGKRVSPNEVTSDERVLAALEDVQQSFDSDATVDPDLDSVLDSLHMDIKWNDLSVLTRGELTEEERATVDLEDAGLLATLDEIERVRAAFRYQRDANEGQLYRAEIPESDELLDLDNPLSEQPQKILDALKSAGILYKPSMTGSAFYQNIKRNPTHYLDKVLSGRELTEAYIYPDRGASMFLNALGIPGLRYLDGNSRADAEGSHNYVIWDEALLTPEKAQIEAMYSRGRSQGASVAKDAQATPLQQFKETEQRIGGKSAYDKAKADGKTKLNYSQWVQVRTPNFKAWFGDWENDPANASKVVDSETGEPMVVYHGSSRDIESFAAGADEAGQSNGNRTGAWGSYFTPSAAEASIYAEIAGGDSPQNVVPVYLAIRNPYVMNRAEWGKHSQRTAKAATSAEGRADAKAVRAGIEALGHDGIVIRDRGFNDEWVAFRPEQIKSSIGNTGAFDSKNPDIRYSRSPSTQAAQNTADSRASTAAQNPSNPSQVWAAIEGVFEGIDGLRQRLDAGTTVVRNADELPQQFQQSAKDAQAQGFYDDESKRIYLVADRIEAGQEKAVWLHEVFHKRGSELLGDTVMARLHGAVQRWGARKAGSVERQIYDAAHARAQADGNYNGEFLAYAIEEAVNRGVQPDLKTNITSAGYWLGKVMEAFRSALNKLTGRAATPKITADELVDIAYAAAGLEAQRNGLPTRLETTPQKELTLEEIGGGLENIVRETENGKRIINADVEAQLRRIIHPDQFRADGSFEKRTNRKLDEIIQNTRVKVGETVQEQERSYLQAAMKLWAHVISDAHKNAHMRYHAMPIGQFNQEDNPLIYKSKSYNRRQSSEYRLVLVDGKPAFARKSNHWGRFSTNIYEGSEDAKRLGLENDTGDQFGRVGWKSHNWELEGGNVDGRNSQAGYVLLEDLVKAAGQQDNAAKTQAQAKELEAQNATGLPLQFSRASQTTGAGVWQAPEATKFDQYTYLLQDKQIDSKRVVNAIKENGKQIADDLDVYLQETLFHGRAAKRVKDFAEQEELPLIELLRDKGLELSELEEYLHARHAPEANWEMSERNPNKAMIEERLKKAVENIAAVEVSLRRAPTDKNIRKEMLDAEAELSKWRNAKPYKGEESDRLALSGMSNEEAAAVMDSLDATKRKNLQAAAKMVDRIIAKTRETIVDYGLESDDTVDAWSRSWNHYVPLMREQLDDVVMGGMGTGQGFSIKGKETKGRTGSTKKVVDILANINMQRERAIVRGEKNRVATALLGLVKDNPNKDFWRIAKPGEIPSTKVIDKKTGLVTTQIDPTYKGRDNALVAKVDGVEQVILFNEDNARAMRMAAALKNMDAANLEGMLGNVAIVTRYLAAINTQYNPIFGIVNMVRDFQEAAINLQTTPLAGKQKQVLGQALTAVWQVGKELRAQREGKTTGSEWGKLWEDFQNEGGQTGYRDMFANSADRSKALQAMLKPDAWADTKAGRFFTVNGALKVPLEILRKTALRPMLDLLSDYNEAIENGVRLSAYKAALDIGMSKPRAAELAKNLTVNFNRKGQVAQQVGALYAFFNASVQGTARMGQTIFDMEPGKPKTIRLSSLGKKIVGGGVLLGSVQALLLAASGFGDDEPPEFIRKRNLVIPNPLSEKGYISIPMPLGYHVLTNLGRIPTEYALSGFKGGSKRAISLLDVMSDIYNPIGGSGLSMQTLAPSVLDPFAALAENKDFTGRAIAKQSFNKVTPGHALGRDNSSMLAQVINYATGGTEYTRGELSPTPDQIDYLIGQVTGGVGREASKVSQSTQAIATGDELPWHKVPLVGRFYGDADSPSAKQSAYYNLMDDVRRHSAEVKGLRNDGKATEAIEYMAENPQATLHIAANAAERQVKKLRDRMDDLKEQNAPRESIKEVETQMTEVMQRFAALVQSKKKP